MTYIGILALMITGPNLGEVIKKVTTGLNFFSTCSSRSSSSSFLYFALQIFFIFYLPFLFACRSFLLLICLFFVCLQIFLMSSSVSASLQARMPTMSLILIDGNALEFQKIFKFLGPDANPSQFWDNFEVFGI